MCIDCKHYNHGSTLCENIVDKGLKEWLATKSHYEVNNCPNCLTLYERDAAQYCGSNHCYVCNYKWCWTCGCSKKQGLFHISPVDYNICNLLDISVFRVNSSKFYVIKLLHKFILLLMFMVFSFVVLPLFGYIVGVVYGAFGVACFLACLTENDNPAGPPHLRIDAVCKKLPFMLVLSMIFLPLFLVFGVFVLVGVYIQVICFFIHLPIYHTFTWR